MPPHLGAARRNAASGTPQIPDHRQRARLATEMLPHAASLETVPSQQARGASPSAMRPRLAPATLRERRHPVRQLFVAVEMVKG